MRLHTLRLIFMFMFYQVIIYGQQVKMSYQAVFRDGSGLLLEEKTVQVEINILDGNGQVKYAEAHQIKTNAQGLGTLRIGEGTAQSGKLEGIDWGKGQFTMRTRLPEFNLESSSPILSVPYAVNSGIADSLRGGIADSLRNFKYKPIADGKQKGELLSWDGKQWLPLKNGKPGEVLSIGEDGTTSWSRFKAGRDTICPESVTDIDGNVYGTVKIGRQCWMRENLRVTRFNDGTPIAFPNSDIGFFSISEEGYPALFPGVNFSLSKEHGYYYNHFVSVTPFEICPSGWRVPNSLDVTKMSLFFRNDLGLLTGGELRILYSGILDSNYCIDKFNEKGERESIIIQAPINRLGVFQWFLSNGEIWGFLKDCDDCNLTINCRNDLDLYYADWGELGASIRCIKD